MAVPVEEAPKSISSILVAKTMNGSVSVTVWRRSVKRSGVLLVVDVTVNEETVHAAVIGNVTVTRIGSDDPEGMF